MKNGFTLIELLAVIVILAIIALIATPIVLNIINDVKESARERSAEFYLDSVEYSISKKVLDGNIISDGTYKIMENGNVCLGTLTNNTCNGDILEVEMNGEKPNGDSITIKDGQIVSHVIKYGNNVIESENESEEQGDTKDPALNHSGIIPEGGTYKRFINPQYNEETYEWTNDGVTTYNAGEPFPTLMDGDIYIYGDYYYCYGYGHGVPSYSEPIEGNFMVKTEGWTSRYYFGKSTTPGVLLESINGQPLMSLTGTFELASITVLPKIPDTVKHIYHVSFASGITSLPEIPSSVQDLTLAFHETYSLMDISDWIIPKHITKMDSTFENCNKITAVPKIPQNITSMSFTFNGCSSLTQTIEIPCHISDEDVNSWYGVPASIQRYHYEGCGHN